ncbi:MAG TPA: FAD:protein FMN transferase [Thermoanaerobaculia bacterium]|jgi:thiamine biosynthesis lipoprotein|nr:FAD:protein FMN transferase [Thermoanaerobaculia bacterium]
MRALRLAALAVLACAVVGAAGGPRTVTVERRLGVMGTELDVKVEAANRAVALDASEAAVRALEAAEARLSTWRENSELARLNRAPVDTPVVLSPRLAAELRGVQHWWRETGGAFDPGIGPLIAAWGLRTGGRVPTGEEREQARAGGGLAGLELAADGRAVRRRPGLRIEEGGWGKGAGLDAAIEALRAGGHARAAVLNLGGQIVVYGQAMGWTVPVADPRDRQRAVIALTISSGSVATSGNSEHGFERDGVRYGHLLDPATGSPARDFGSLTVWAPEALAADCLSKLYVLGPDAALAWARAHQDVEVLILEPLPGGLRARATAGWRGRLKALVPELEVEIEHGGL